MRLIHDHSVHTNKTTLECLREIGIEAKAREVSWPVSEYSTYTRFCKTLVGEEIYRAYVFGNDPHRHVRVYTPGIKLEEAKSK